MKHLLYLTIALAGMLTLSAPAAQADGPTCPVWQCGSNGRGLDGRQVALPDGLRIVGAPAVELQKITSRGLTLESRRVATPDLTGLSIDHGRFPGDAWGIRPIDQRWPDAGRNWLVQE